MRDEVLVIGAGIAGLSVAAALSATHRVRVVDGESQPGYHSSGRSAAVFVPPYLNDSVARLSLASEAFLDRLPPDYPAASALSPRSGFKCARADQSAVVDAYLDRWRGLCPWLREIDPDDACARVPILHRRVLDRVLEDDHVRDIDVHTLMEGHRRRCLAGGGEIRLNQTVTRLTAVAGGWDVYLAGASAPLRAAIVINAAGAWADEVAALAGVQPVGLTPKRRTAVLVAAPAAHRVDAWPMVHGIDGDWYFKPESGRLLLSPADQTPSPPCDAQPDELDVALAVDRVQRAAALPVSRLERTWAGLRTFAADERPVVGFDPTASGFFWLAGQGGFGFQTSPALAAMAAALITGAALPPWLAASGVDAAGLSPARLVA